MARYTCPSCGAAYNGKRCRACNYEHFSEEIAHGGHTHKGEPLVIDSPVRRPIPRKDPFGCDPKTRKRTFPRRQRKQRPFVGLLTIFLLISGVLPLLRDWGLELERREEAIQMEMALPEDLITLYEEGPITISTQPRCLDAFGEEGLRLWVRNKLNHSDVFLSTKYVMADGFVLPNTGLYMECSADSMCLDTLYLNGDNLKDAGISQVRELSFVLECMDEDYTVLFETDPITITREIPAQPEPDFNGPVLLDSDGFRILDLRYQPDPEHPQYENGWRLFYVENNTDAFLTMNSREVTVGGEAADLFLWCDLPARSKAVVRLELWGLEDLEFTTPSELGDLDMTLEFWNPDDYSGSVTEFSITLPMINKETVEIR